MVTSHGSSRARPFLTFDEPPAPRPSVGPRRFSTVRGYVMAGDDRPPAELRPAFEAIIHASTVGRDQVHDVQFERRRILSLVLDEQFSVAEVAAALQIPIGIVQILAAALIQHGLLEVRVPQLNQADDLALLKRLINGFRTL